MADQSLTSNRRQFLSASAAIAAATAVAVPVNVYAANPRHQWDAAMARLEAAEIAARPWDDELSPPEHISRESYRAYRAVFDMPAPDRAALRYKLEELLKYEDEHQVMADIARLLGDA